MSLQFVNVTPATQAEKQQNQKVIRSAAMKTFRRNQKLQKLKEQGETSNCRTVKEKPKTDINPSSEQEQEYELTQASSSFSGFETTSSELPQVSTSNSEYAAISSEMWWSGSVSPDLTATTGFTDDGIGFANSEYSGSARQSTFHAILWS
jgi:hypothetical protein